jgi:hypothetical protein
LRPVAEAKTFDTKKNWDRNYVHSLGWRWLTTPLSNDPREAWLRPEVAGQRREHDAARAAVRGGRRREWHLRKLDITKWTFLNTDLVVHIHRVPDGEWIGVRTETNYGPDGIGTTIDTLFDERGAIGGIR